MSPHAILVHGLPDSTEEATVREFFSRIGEIASCTMNGTSATLAFDKKEDFDEALNMNGLEFQEGAVLRVEAAPETAPETAPEAPLQSEDAAEAKTNGEDSAAPPLDNRNRFPDDFKIAIRQLASGTTEEQLRDIFEPLGTIGDLFIHPTRNYAFVGFDNADSLEAALQMAHREINGAVVEIEKKRINGRDARNNKNAGSGIQGEQEKKIVVKGIPSDSTEEALRAFFGSFGEVEDIFIHPTKSFAFIGFATEEACTASLRMDGEAMNGSQIHIERRQRQRCFKCNKEGHVAMQCRATDRSCRNCGRSGHIARECRAAPRDDYRSRDRLDRRDDRRDFRHDDRRDNRRDFRHDDRRDDRRRARSRSNSYDRYRRRSRSRSSRSPKRFSRYERSRSRSPVRRRY